MAYSAAKNESNGKLLQSTIAVKFYFTLATRVIEGGREGHSQEDVGVYKEVRLVAEAQTNGLGVRRY